MEKCINSFFVSEVKLFVSTFEKQTLQSLHVFYNLGIYLVFYRKTKISW